jgi:hypothetical protein
MKRYCLFLAAMLLTCIETTSAQPVIDGALGSDAYGTALSVQNTDTQFGNSATGDLLIAGGSEIDQVFGTVAGGRLNVLITGNLETNFNKLVVFVDSAAGGMNQLNGANLPSGFDAFCGRCGGGFTPPRGDAPPGDGGLQNMNLLIFDEGFTADYALSFTHGNESVDDSTSPTNFYAMSAHYADLTQGTAGEVTAAGIVLAPQGMPNVLRLPGEGLGDFPFYPSPPVNPTSSLIGPALPNLGQGELIDRDYALTDGGCADDTGAGCIARELEFVLDVDPAEQGLPNPADNNGSDHRNFRNTVDLKVAVDNSNSQGVDGFNAAFPDTVGNPQDVTTGVEFSIPLSEIGNPSGPIKLTVFVNGSDYDYASNQFAGVGTLQGNEGSDGNGGFMADQLMFNLATIAGDQFVTVAAPPLGDGDHNNDGTVDAADYVAWRKTDAGNQLGYDAFFQQFGQTGVGSGGAAGVPEPASVALVALGMLAAVGIGRRR